MKKFDFGKRKMTLGLSIILCQLSISPAVAQVPAFPGAEGHGRYITGGRGGKIVHVTNLNDSGTGSFRQAVKGNDKKIVVFDVGGVIALNSAVNIGANTTIEGQTAPAPGITLRYYTVNPAGNNIIMRFIRIRRGQERDVNDGADASTARNYTGMMLDHCSLSWSIDEVASFYDNNNFTMQWCTIGESLVNAGHNKGAHGYGGIWGGKLASFHHNLICHVANRSPRFNGARYNWNGYTGNKLYSEYKWENTLQAENVDFRNCVIYNCGNGCYGGPGGGQVNIVNNYYKTGPSGTTNRITTASLAGSGNAGDDQTFWDMSSRYYINGNQMNNTKNFDWQGVSCDNGTPYLGNVPYTKDPNHYYGSGLTYTKISGVDCISMKLDEPAPTGEVTTHTAATAFDKVMSFAGASLSRDNVDERYMNEARNGTATYKNGRIDLVSDANGYTEANFGTGSRQSGFDTDNDGIPNAWETANGLNPNDATDAAKFTLDPAKYYTNIEVYVNSLVQDIMTGGNADADSTVKEYYPAYVKEDGTQVEAIGAEFLPKQNEGSDVSYTIAQDTYLNSSSTTVWNFCDNNIVVTNTNNKAYSTGKENGIKFSAATQYTIQLPDGVSISKATFTGYDNYADADSYIGELNGVSYGETEYVFPQKVGDNYTSVSREVEITPAASGTLTFTPKGKQVVWTIKLDGKQGSSAAIASVDAETPQVKAEYYTLQGMRIAVPQQGVVVRVTTMADGTKKATKIFIR